MFTKFKKVLLLTPLLLLTACESPDVRNIKHEYVDNNPGNYRTVTSTVFKASTYDAISANTSPDVLLDKTFTDAKIEYKSTDGAVITYEYVNTIREAINQNKNGMTLVTGDGRGTNITYEAVWDDGKTENKTYNVPFIAEFNPKEIVTENDLINQIDKNAPELTYQWTGQANGIIDTIIIEAKDDYTTTELKYNSVSKKHELKNVTRTRVTTYTYKYDKTLQLLTSSESN